MNMEKSKCCQAEVVLNNHSILGEVCLCDKCHKPCELMEQSTTTYDAGNGILKADRQLLFDKIQNYFQPNSTDGKKLSAEDMLHKHHYFTEKSFFDIEIKNNILKAMQEFSSQKDAQIQALSKEVEELKKRLAYEKANNWTTLSVEYNELRIAGDKLAELLIPIYKDTHLKEYSDAIANWEKLNK